MNDFQALLSHHPERRFNAGDGVIGYREAGSQSHPAVVLLHGISSGAASWVCQLENLSADTRVVAWDAPGYGASTPLSTRHPLASDYARALDALVNGIGLRSFTLVGHSLGALMAAAYAAAQPQRVRRLVLLSPAGGYADALPAERERKYADRLATFDRLGPEGVARERAAALVSPSAPAEVVAWIARNMRRLNVLGYGQAAWMLANDGIGRYASNYPGAVAVASGEVDHITPVERCRTVAEVFRRATHEVLAGVGHAFYLEDPAGANAFLRRQLATVRQPAQEMT